MSKRQSAAASVQPVDDAERVAPAYSQLLREAVRTSGLLRKDLLGPKGSGRSSTVLWRVLGHNEAPSFGAAARVRERLLELRPDLDIPPPSVAVEGVDHYAWLKIGTDLLADDPEGFQKMLGRVRQIYEAMLRERANKSALGAMHSGRVSDVRRPRAVAKRGANPERGKKSDENIRSKDEP